MRIAKIIPLNSQNIQHEPGKDHTEKKSSQKISLDLLMEESRKVKDTCHVEGYKDIKSCTISFLPKKTKQRKMISLAADYALNNLGMETVFIRIQPEDYLTIRYLNENQFECLGDEKGSIIYLREKPY